ncbi:MAG: TIGR04282 family arsenosugar biosynthesis glycosyltransferase [Anaerolineales bacterium]|jgi:rSAM/selenodomain-associated transferase 1
MRIAQNMRTFAQRAFAPMPNPALIIMAKEPTVGSTKTRLTPPLSPAQAAALYEALLKDTIVLSASMKGIDLTIAVTPSNATGYFERIRPPGAHLLPVDCEHIGDCLSQVIARLLEKGHPKVCALNSDGPSLPLKYIQRAFDLLDDHDVIFGPNEDGGYYLVGLKQLHAEIFTGIPWSTSQVLPQTLEKAKALGLRAALLAPWYDVDSAADVARLQRELEGLPLDKLVHTRRYFESHA